MLDIFGNRSALAVRRGILAAAVDDSERRLAELDIGLSLAKVADIQQVKLGAITACNSVLLRTIEHIICASMPGARERGGRGGSPLHKTFLCLL